LRKNFLGQLLKPAFRSREERILINLNVLAILVKPLVGNRTGDFSSRKKKLIEDWFCGLLLLSFEVNAGFCIKFFRKNILFLVAYLSIKKFFLIETKTRLLGQKAEPERGKS